VGGGDIRRGSGKTKIPARVNRLTCRSGASIDKTNANNTNIMRISFFSLFLNKVNSKYITHYHKGSKLNKVLKHNSVYVAPGAMPNRGEVQHCISSDGSIPRLKIAFCCCLKAYGAHAAVRPKRLFHAVDLNFVKKIIHLFRYFSF
jgi:hypothetical protein